MNKKANYSFDVLIGEGGFARIFLCTYIPTGERVVIKEISRTPRSASPATFSSSSDSSTTSARTYSRMIDRDSVNEIMALSKLRNTEGVVHMYSYFKDSQNYYIVMEYIDGDDLNNYTISNYRKYLQRMGHIHKEDMDTQVAPWSEDSARRIFMNIIRAVQSIHRKRIVHLDLKLENIMINKHNEVKIIDFGLCELLDNPWTKLSSAISQASSPSSSSACSPVKLTKYVGSIDYAAPEVVHKKPYDGYLADSWNLGVVLYILLQAKYPFQHPRLSHSLHFQDQRHDDSHDEVLNVNHSRRLSSEARDLLQKMLTQEADKRLTLDEVLSHPWFSRAPISH